MTTAIAGKWPPKYTSEFVADEQGIPVAQLLDSSGYRPEEIDHWSIEDVPLDEAHGKYDPQPYVEEEGEYMIALARAVGASDAPLPAFVHDDRGYVHADGAHRTVIAMLCGDETILAYVAHLVPNHPNRPT